MRVALAAVTVACGTVVTVATPAYAAAPAAVTDFSIDTQEPGAAWVEWTPSADTPDVVICWRSGVDSQHASPPATPTDAGATCSDVITRTTDTYYEIRAGGQVGASVFSYDPSTGDYGAPASGSVSTTYKPPMEPAIATTPAGPHAVTLSWLTPGGPHDDYLVSWARGTATPSAGSAGSTTAHSQRISGLTSGAVYTFAVRGRDNHGIGPAIVLRAQTRSPGIAMASDRASGAISSTAPHGGVGPDSEPAAQLDTSGVLHSAYVTGDALNGDVEKLHVATYTPGHGWTDQIVGHNGPEYGYTGEYGHVAVAGAPGITAVAFELDGTYVATRTGRAWSAQHKVSNGALVALAVDSERRVHLVVRRDNALHYVVRAGSRTTDSVIRGTAALDNATMTRDAGDDRIIVAVRHYAGHAETLRVSSVAPAATSLTGFRPWLSLRNSATHWYPRDVAANGGRITLLLGRFTGAGIEEPLTYRGVYVQSGTSRSHATPVHVPDTGISAAVTEDALHVTAPTANRVVLSWRRYDPAWSKQGLWLATRHREPKTGRWTFSGPKRWRSSAYDQPLGAWADRNGHLHLAYVTSATDAPTVPPPVFATYS